MSSHARDADPASPSATRSSDSQPPPAEAPATDAERGQVTGSAAEIYEAFFVPALFGEWAGPMADAAGVGVGERVLDVACGTGVLAREALARVGPGGGVVGLDPNPGMLAVAGRAAPGVMWREGVAESLPFDDDAFDTVLCGFGLMFFDDRVAALREMRRVLRPGGRLAVSVWAGLDRTPGYRAMVALLRDEFGDEPADALTAPFVLGDGAELRSLFAGAGMPDAEIETRMGTARFESLDGWIHTDIHGWTLAGMLDEAEFARLQVAARERLAEFVGEDGSVRFASPGHIVTWREGSDRS
jgi:SAM-dependent methyltransferase